MVYDLIFRNNDDMATKSQKLTEYRYYILVHAQKHTDRVIKFKMKH